jgi:release factor glutamine methyltransferase
LPFIVTRDVLIPRPETEVLVEEALGIVKEMKDEALTVADVGVGSGPIAIAMLSEVEGLRAVAGDVSAAALDVAHGNARANGVAERVQFVHGAGLQPLFVANQERPFDLVLSNPPYITEGDFPGVMREVREWEPKQALTAGAQGLDVIAPLIDSAGGGMLKPGGALLIEIGSSEQAELTTGLLKSAGFADSRIRNDYSGHARVVVGTL